MGNANRWWKLLGVASVVGVVATGALVARLDQAEAPDAEPPSAG